MAGYRKLGRTSSQRKALLRNQVTNLLYHGKIRTTEAKAKEVQRIAEKLITLAVKERDNFETVKITAKVARKDKDGKRVKQIIDRDTKKVLSETHRDKDGNAEEGDDSGKHHDVPCAHAQGGVNGVEVLGLKLKRQRAGIDLVGQGLGGF